MGFTVSSLTSPGSKENRNALKANLFLPIRKCHYSIAAIDGKTMYAFHPSISLTVPIVSALSTNGQGSIMQEVTWRTEFKNTLYFC